MKFLSEKLKNSVDITIETEAKLRYIIKLLKQKGKTFYLSVWQSLSQRRLSTSLY